MKALCVEIYRNIGLIKFQGIWRIFGDNSSRHIWGINLDSLDDIPRKRRTAISVDLSNVHSYIDALEAEIMPHQIQTNLGQRWIMFVINFDEKIFVDGSGDDAYFLSIADLIPSDWLYIVGEPLFYVPTAISNLWIRKQKTDLEKVLIATESTIGAVHYKREWRFFIAHKEAWILDFASCMRSSGYIDWPSDRRFSDWRKELPVVSEDNVSLFIASLLDYELSIDEVSNLEYYLSDDDKFQLEAAKGSLTNLQDDAQRKNMELIIAAWGKPKLSFSIDFDNRTYLKLDYSAPILAEIESSKLFAPAHWECFIGNPVNYLPKDLQELWK